MTQQFAFTEWEQRSTDKPFLNQPIGDKWETYTWHQAGQMARRLATGLHSLGLPAGSHIGLISGNCREWVIADIAIAMAGYVSVPFYPTLIGKELNELITLGDVQALFVGKIADWDELKTGIAENLPVIAFPHYHNYAKVDRGLKWHEFIEQHSPLEQIHQPDEDEVWSIIFTSGTTGTPKGVELTYGACHRSKNVINEPNRGVIDENGNNRFFSFLPLNHIAERLVVELACMRFGGEIFFAESVETFTKNMQDSQPTVFFGVPRIWTKMQLAILGKIPQKKLDRLLSIPVVSTLIKRKLRKALGLNQAKGCITAAAPISFQVKQWFQRLGIPIIEAYGMTETFGIASIGEIGHNIEGSVGRASVGVELKIDEATNEVLVKTDYTMRGYYKDPNKTTEVIQDGWYHTGDQGSIDANGNLFITGRVKDTFKTAKGKFIIPAPIEWELEINPDIEQICVVGLGISQPIALMVPSAIGAAKNQLQLQESLQATLEHANSKLPGYSQVATIVIMQDEWSSANGFLTPTLKVKRNILDKHYLSKYESWCNQPESVIRETDNT